MKLGDWDRQPIRNKNWTSFRLKANGFAPLFLNQSVRRFIIVRNPMVRTISAFIRTFKYSEDERYPKLPSYFEKWVLKNINWDLSKETNIRPITWNKYKQPNIHLPSQTMFFGCSVRHVWNYFSIIKMQDKKLIVDYIHKCMPEEFFYVWGQFN